MAIKLLVNIDVEDLERAIEFYSKALGLRLGGRLFEKSVAERLGASSRIHLLAKPAGTFVSVRSPQRQDY